MGALLTTRQHDGVEEIDVVSNHAYKYPPRSGNYFGSHFIMGGERFDTPQPEAYLFGENSDLNFLGNRPTPIVEGYNPKNNIKNRYGIETDLIHRKITYKQNPDRLSESGYV